MNSACDGAAGALDKLGLICSLRKVTTDRLPILATRRIIVCQCNQERAVGLRDFTLADVIERNAQLFPNKTALVFEDGRVSHAEYHARVKHLAEGLARAGVGTADRIVILSHNNLEFVVVYGAVAFLGAVLVPINWRLSADEIAFIVSDAAPKVVIADHAHQDVLSGVQNSYKSAQLWLGVGGAEAPFIPFEDMFVTQGEGARRTVRASSPFVIFYTAAVSGRPRGAVISQASLVAVSGQLMHYWSLAARDVNYGVLPLFHLAGLTMLLACQHAGGASVIARRFEAAEAVRCIRKESVTLLAEFPPILGALLDAAKDPADIASLRIVTGLDTPETIRRFERQCLYGRFWVAFGQSETSGFVTMAPFGDRPGSAGRSMYLSTVAVVDSLDRLLPTGEVGEIVVRGPGVFEGYWNCEADTAAVFRNGWHHTGDNGAFDADGYLWYKGRSAAKELIKPGGENVYPAEVEAVLVQHPAVLEAVVFGVADLEWGEAIKAVCVLNPGQSADPRDIIDFVAVRIARYKRPKHLMLAESLPKSGSGAIDRAKVRDAFREV